VSRAKNRDLPKQPIDTAPRDRSWIIVLAGPKQEPVEAYWSGTFRGWARCELVVQHLVTHWMPGAEAHVPRIADFSSMARRRTQ
jgi:hypothetical protein